MDACITWSSALIAFLVGLCAVGILFVIYKLFETVVDNIATKSAQDVLDCHEWLNHQSKKKKKKEEW